jgi:hypothetical protein
MTDVDRTELQRMPGLMPCPDDLHHASDWMTEQTGRSCSGPAPHCIPPMGRIWTAASRASSVERLAAPGPGHASGPIPDMRQGRRGSLPAGPAPFAGRQLASFGGQDYFLAVVLPWTTSFTADCRMDWPEITTALVFPMWAFGLSVTWTQK